MSRYKCKACVEVYKKYKDYEDMQCSQLAEERKNQYDYVNKNSGSKNR